MQKTLFFFKPKTMQAVGIRKPAKRAELLGLERVLQFVCHGHVSHGRDYSKPRRPPLRCVAELAVNRAPRETVQSCAWRSRNALTITETELNVIAALAMIGLSSNPKKG